jgi:hypothetical protein
MTADHPRAGSVARLTDAAVNRRQKQLTPVRAVNVRRGRAHPAADDISQRPRSDGRNAAANICAARHRRRVHAAVGASLADVVRRPFDAQRSASLLEVLQGGGGRGLTCVGSRSRRAVARAALRLYRRDDPAASAPLPRDRVSLSPSPCDRAIVLFLHKNWKCGVADGRAVCRLCARARVCERGARLVVLYLCALGCACLLRVVRVVEELSARFRIIVSSEMNVVLLRRCC